MLVVEKHKSTRLRQFNNFLTVVVVLLGLYMIITPFVPEILFWIRGRQSSAAQVKYESNLEQTADTPQDLPKPPNKHLVIPGIQLDGEVFEGASARTLDMGIWRRPKTSTPDKGGNTVLVAHRFVYTGTAPFYHLDKMKKGDKFALFWDRVEYDYEVTDIKVVAPTAIEIENNTSEPTLTLYTCTPMWTAKQRLVIVAKLISETPIND